MAEITRASYVHCARIVSPQLAVGLGSRNTVAKIYYRPFARFAGTTTWSLIKAIEWVRAAKRV